MSGRLTHADHATAVTGALAGPGPWHGSTGYLHAARIIQRRNVALGRRVGRDGTPLDHIALTPRADPVRSRIRSPRAS
ncbi:hypothetical protein ACIP4Y_33525 [Streptomyces sp. NPDC088810]|uniref:hypothetical protein n=1 Tax=Streptomyces sp. NPDC088810 TaxID=3365904 RepID=UPI0038104F74